MPCRSNLAPCICDTRLSDGSQNSLLRDCNTIVTPASDGMDHEDSKKTRKERSRKPELGISMLDTLVLIGSDSQPIFRSSRRYCFAPSLLFLRTGTLKVLYSSQQGQGRKYGRFVVLGGEVRVHITLCSALFRAFASRMGEFHVVMICFGDNGSCGALLGFGSGL